LTLPHAPNDPFVLRDGAFFEFCIKKKKKKILTKFKKKSRTKQNCSPGETQYQNAEIRFSGENEPQMSRK